MLILMMGLFVNELSFDFPSEIFHGEAWFVVKASTARWPPEPELTTSTAY